MSTPPRSRLPARRRLPAVEQRRQNFPHGTCLNVSQCLVRAAWCESEDLQDVPPFQVYNAMGLISQISNAFSLSIVYLFAPPLPISPSPATTTYALSYYSETRALLYTQGQSIHFPKRSCCYMIGSTDCTHWGTVRISAFAFILYSSSSRRRAGLRFDRVVAC